MNTIFGAVTQREFYFSGGSSVILTQNARLGVEVDRPAIRPTEEPIFSKIVTEWGYPPIGVPWTGQRPCEGLILSDE